jgi:hypothetical protein
MQVRPQLTRLSTFSYADISSPPRPSRLCSSSYTPDMYHDPVFWTRLYMTSFTEEETKTDNQTTTIPS